MILKKRILAIDFGLKRTGLAMSDESATFAFGHSTVGSRQLMKVLQQLIPKEKITVLLLGEPKRLNLEDAHISENVRQLKEVLEKQFPDLEVVLYDERFTSKMAFQTMIDGGLGKKQRQNKALIDEISATILLQSYLSFLEHAGRD